MFSRITGKSFSEVLDLESVNPQYDERLFIEFPEKYKFTTCVQTKNYKITSLCTNIVLNVKQKQKDTIFVHNIM
jgi:hypothetical protein